ncbi:class D sortase [Paenibacillus sp. LHD-117]|uniref:class D sortase n=1 Tax=Paenibacillus sp. LHD-117 TaxID=3071412 RepID=UPI0027E18332|nr:class D sortase [Paenibacillus sp. LHD-117]MDQ6418347.1 class D sortase [Paenibacillus sp. LHD-117]
MRKIAAYGLVLVGVLILAYPKASEWYNDRQQEKLMAQWEIAALDEEAGEEAREQYDGLTTLFSESLEEEEVDATEPAVTESAAASAEPSATKAPATSQPKQEAIATIRIPSIKLKLPVLEGATQKNMRSAAAHLKETAPIGEVGNAAIAAHRMRAKGKLFNRLNEVKIGDEIIVETRSGKFTYIVYDLSIVEPSDVSVLNYNNKDKRLTLITCDPVVNPTHRLIVHAAMEQ